jgi:hypothetical protein
MTSRQYAAEKQRIAGGIKALIATNLPCATNCAAHPINTQTIGLLADGQAADAQFWGNGGIQEIADAVAIRVGEDFSPNAKPREWKKTMPLPGGRSFDWTEARIWRAVIVAVIVIAQAVFGGAKIDAKKLLMEPSESDMQAVAAARSNDMARLRVELRGEMWETIRKMQEKRDGR